MSDPYPHWIARTYDRHAFMWKLYVPVIRSLFAHKPRPMVLDLGCGTGSLLIELSDFIASGCGVDIAPAMITLSREKARAAGIVNLVFEVNDLLQVPLDRQYDLVACTDGVLPNLQDSSLLALFISRLPGILAPRGIAIIELWTPSANTKPTTCTTEMPIELPDFPGELLTQPFFCEIDHVSASGETRYRFHLPDKAYSYVILKDSEHAAIHRHFFYHPADVRSLITSAGLFIRREMGLRNEAGTLTLGDYSDSSTVWIPIVSQR